MSAKLEWDETVVILGPWVLAEVKPVKGGKRGACKYRVAKGEWSRQYERIQDCVQDCESEVRRLLREAGVEVE